MSPVSFFLLLPPFEDGFAPFLKRLSAFLDVLTPKGLVPEGPHLPDVFSPQPLTLLTSIENELQPL